jgi:hypothetical protein
MQGYPSNSANHFSTPPLAKVMNLRIYNLISDIMLNKNIRRILCKKEKITVISPHMPAFFAFHELCLWSFLALVEQAKKMLSYDGTVDIQHLFLARFEVLSYYQLLLSLFALLLLIFYHGLINICALIAAAASKHFLFHLLWHHKDRTSDKTSYHLILYTKIIIPVRQIRSTAHILI